MLNNRNKRFMELAQDFFKSLKPFCVSGLTNYIEKIISIDVGSIKTLKITHIWIFSQCKLSMFLHFSSIFSGRILSFEIIKFILKKECFPFKHLKNGNYRNIFLFLNNLSEKSSLGIFLNKQFRKIVPVERNSKIILEKFSKIILFDFDDDLEIMEYRCYIISNTSLLLPRKVRKLKKLNRYFTGNTIIKKNFFEETSENKRLCSDVIKNAVRIIEIGPRITTKLLK